MQHDSPSSTLSSDSRTATAIICSISSCRGPHLRGAWELFRLDSRRSTTAVESWRATGADDCGSVVSRSLRSTRKRSRRQSLSKIAARDLESGNRGKRTTPRPTLRGARLLHRNDHSRRSTTTRLEHDDQRRGAAYSWRESIRRVGLTFRRAKPERTETSDCGAPPRSEARQQRRQRRKSRSQPQ